MFCNKYLTQNHPPVNMGSHGLLFKEEQFNSFNPNTCNLGHMVFNNDMRQQIRNVELEDGKVSEVKKDNKEISKINSY